MPNTYTLIEKITVGAAGASDVTFTNIPQTYTDLYIIASARTNLSGSASDNIYMQFNGSTAANYDFKRLLGDGSTASSSGAASNAKYFLMGSLSAANATANTFGSLQSYIPNYTGSSKKSGSNEGVAESNATAVAMSINATLWNLTDAITSIKLLSYDAANFVQYSTFYLYGVAKEGVNPSTSSAPYATGGDKILYDGTYWYHAFTSSGTFTPKKGLSCEVLVVAGGGGAANAGGGAGGLSYHSSKSLTNNTNYTVTIGGGGTGAPVNNNTATNGSNSVFSDITSNGGGADAGSTARSGGSGSGAYVGSGGAATQGNTGGATGYGNAGGGPSTNVGGSGGGAGAAGTAGGVGGAGLNTWSSWATATSTGASGYYAGGGGTYNYGNGSTTAGGAGGGGSGGGGSGTANTGGGAGAGLTGGNGGSGIVIVRYAV